MGKVSQTAKVDIDANMRRTLLEAGTHFYCLACTFTLRIDLYQSDDPRYCVDCYAVIHDKPVEPEPAEAVTDQDIEVDRQPRPVTTAAPVRRRGRPPKELPVNKILESSKIQSEIAADLEVSQATISRRRHKAQGVLSL